MKRAALILTIIVALVALACGFGAATAALDITQPAAASTSATINFVVNKGDTTTAVADHLQHAGLIRNAEIFRLWARYKHLDTGIQYGVYKLSPSMTMDDIIAALQKSQPDFQIVSIPDTLRVTQYPDHITTLKNFDAKTFLQIAQTGKFSDGTPVSSTYWYVSPPKKGAVYALEGYLYPDTYYIDTGANTDEVVKSMLDELGQHLCPGPSGQPNAYIHDEKQCLAHAAQVSGTDIFTAMEKAYYTKDPVLALYAALTISSLTTREILHYSDAPGVSAVYYNRFVYAIHKSSNDGGTAGYMGADPSVQYARDTDHPPTNGKWWAPLDDSANKIDCKSVYNTEAGCHVGLPPGPIAAATWQVILSAAAPIKSPNFYFVSDQCGKIHYWTNADDFNNGKDQALAEHNC